jgi:hypothetical protein
MNNIPLWRYMSKLQRSSWVSGLLGFIIKFTTTTTSGGVVVYRNWSALAFGAATLVLGLASIPESLKDTENRSQKLAAIGVALLFSAILFAMGFGIFYSG